MKLLVILTAVAAVSAIHLARADEWQGRQDTRRDTRTVVFNMFCKFKSHDDDDRYKKCFAAARFSKDVWWQGQEIQDDSEYPFNPAFEIECDGNTLFNASARRFTDYQGTRIQAETGPYPAVELPSGTLYDLRHVTEADLELRDQTFHGICHLYTGAP